MTKTTKTTRIELSRDEIVEALRAVGHSIPDIADLIIQIPGRGRAAPHSFNGYDATFEVVFTTTEES